MKRQYRVYVLPVTEQTLAYARKQPFYLIEESYVLVYSDKTRIKNGNTVPAETLSARDIAWVQSCNEQIVRELVRDDERTAQNMMQFLDRLAEELQNEREKMQKGGMASGTDAI